MDKNIGKKLDGRYEITELIGVGGMADVYKGKDVTDNKTVAIKILKKEFADNEEFLSRFRTESKATAVLSHPNIVKIYDVGFSERLQYIIMEYIDGITLKEYIEDEKALNWKDSVHFMIQILRALQHAHDRGVVHRDIKPQNIMLFTDGTIKVMDFGIAKFTREPGKTATDQAIGSVHYISPEQARGEFTDAKSDIYSVGVMLYEMLTGEKPFDSDNSVSIAVMNMQEKPRRPRAVNPNVPLGLEEIILKTMEKNPADRYQSAVEMITDIERFKANPNIAFGYYSENEPVLEDDYDSQADMQNNDYFLPENNNLPQNRNERYSETNRNDVYYEEDDDDEEEHRGSLVVPVLTAVTIVVIIAGVVFVATLLMSMFKDKAPKGDYSMPNFIGMDYNEAVSLYGKDLNIEVESKEYNSISKGCIFEQDIDPNTAFNKGDTIKVKVSLGMQTVKVPDGYDINYFVYQRTLKELGLESEVRRDSSDKVAVDQIIRTEPEANTEVEPGTTIILYVSAGKSDSQLKLDNFVGMTVEDALIKCSYNQLTNVKTVDGPSYEKEGIVYEQSILPGEVVNVDQEITLYVSNGVAPDGEVPFTMTLPNDAEGRFVFDFIVNNKGVASSGTVIAPTMSYFQVNVPGTGKDVRVSLSLTNLNNNATVTVGSYIFDFSEQSFKVSSENIRDAFEAVGGIRVETEPTTEELPPPPPPDTEPEPPATEPPATEPPATEPPATEPPVTDPPTTEPPVTDPPVDDTEQEAA